MAMFDYLEDALLNHVYRNTPYTPPTTVYVAFFSTPCTDAAPGTEVVGGSYVRQAVTFAAPVSGDGQCLSDVAVTFTNLPDTEVASVALMDAETVGNGLTYKNLTTPKAYNAGDNVTIAVGDLIAQFG